MDNEQKVLEGFNHGYTIAKYDHELYDAITKSTQPSGDYFKAFVSGGREFEREKQTPSISKSLDKDNTPNRPPNRDIEKDR